MNRIIILSICFLLSACGTDYAKLKEQLVLESKNKVTLLITEHETELKQFSEFLVQSPDSFISNKV
jgi:hypothetical protein